MSGRSRPSSVAISNCVAKSQCSSMPAISTTRRSVISPQRPRVAGVRSALTSRVVSRDRFAWLSLTLRRCSLSVEYAEVRSFSISCSF